MLTSALVAFTAFATPAFTASVPQYPHILSPRVLPPDVPASFGYHLLPWQADNDVEGAPPSVSNTVSASGSLTAAAPSATPSEDGEDSLSGREHLTYDNAVKECQKACGPWLKRLKEEGRCLSWSPAGNATGADEITRDGVALACTGKRVASLALFCEHLDEASQCGECVSDLLGAPFEMMGSQLNSARKECKEGGYSFPGEVEGASAASRRAMSAAVVLGAFVAALLH